MKRPKGTNYLDDSWLIRKLHYWLENLLVIIGYTAFSSAMKMTLSTRMQPLWTAYAMKLIPISNTKPTLPILRARLKNTRFHLTKPTIWMRRGSLWVL
jgi:hypothetical protein